MKSGFAGRRDFLRQAGLGSVALMAGLPESAIALGREPGRVIETALRAPVVTEEPTAHPIKFAVCGMSHDHIYGMIGAIQRGGGELVAAWGGEPDKLAGFTKRFPDVRIVKTQDEILNHPSVQLVLSSQIANERAPLGVRVMQHGKDYLSDKPGATTLEQLAEVRKTIAATKQIYAILYSERLEVKAAVYAGVLIQQGAIGKVIQTINIAPHQIIQGRGDAGGGSARPDWFWNPDQYGGILCDIGCCAAIVASATCAWIGLRPTALAHGAMVDCSFSALMDTSRFVNISMWRLDIRGIISSSSTASRPNTLTAITCRCHLDRSLLRTL
ncbi:MAG: hypothetical protein ABSF53_10785 [Terracidiphilus sp.]|jgi:hypothetical protein